MTKPKFRAFDKRDNKMHEVFGLTKISVCYEENAELICYEELTDDIIIVQYTGRKDVNKMNIYSGDIVIDPLIKDKKWVIEYRVDTEYVGFIPVEIGTNYASQFISWVNMVIIGNKFENPELMTL